MKHLVYLVGPPGVGKSSVMAALTQHCERVPRSGPLAHDILYRPQPVPESARVVGVELGRRRAAYSGTDALGMAVQPHAVEWIGRATCPLVLGEGARLGNVGFLSAARLAGYALYLVHLSADGRTLADRRLQRGSHQSPVWIRGAETRARRIMERMEPDSRRYFVVTGHLTPQQIADFLVGEIPVLGVLG